MLPDYTYYRPTAPDEDLSTYFAERLTLERVEDSSPFPLKSDRWWVHTVRGDEDWEEEAARIGISANDMVLVVFEPSKGLSTAESFEADVDLFTAVLDQLNNTPGLTGLLQHGDVKVLIERASSGPALLDSSLADPDDYNHDGHLAPVLAQGTVTDLVDFD
jgi:hypothetical protein